MENQKLFDYTTEEFIEKFEKEKQNYLTTLSVYYNMCYDDVEKFYNMFGSRVEMEIKKFKHSGMSCDLYLFRMFNVY